MALKLLSPLLSILLASLLALEPVMAQSVAAPGPTSEALQIKVVDSSISAALHGLTVVISDTTGTPVRDAAVIFRLPDNGSPARFADGTLAAVTYTDADGKARAGEIRGGDAPGSISVRVTAVKGTVHAGLLFEPTQASPAVLAPLAVRQSIPVEPPTPIQMPQPQSPRVSTAPQRVSISRPAIPGSLPAVSVVNGKNTDDNGETDEDSPDTNVPSRHSLGASNLLEESPEVAISSSGAASGGHSKTKWIAVLAIAAGTGAALAFVHKGNSSSSTSSSGVSIGSPTISVGHP